MVDRTKTCNGHTHNIGKKAHLKRRNIHYTSANQESPLDTDLEKSPWATHTAKTKKMLDSVLPWIWATAWQKPIQLTRRQRLFVALSVFGSLILLAGCIVAMAVMVPDRETILETLGWDVAPILDIELCGSSKKEQAFPSEGLLVDNFEGTREGILFV